MATTSLEAIRRIEIEARSKGLDEVAAKLDKVAQSQEGVVASSTNVTKSAGSTEQAFKRVERQLDPTVIAYERYASAVKAVNDQLAQGGDPKRGAELFSLAEARLNKATGAVQQFGKATGTALAGPARHEMMNFSAQLQDIGVSLIGGQSPFTVMAQQVPQLTSVVAASNASLGQFVSTAVTGAARFLAAWGPLAAGVAAVGAAAVAAMHVLEQEREARIATTSGRGRLSGLNADDIDAMAARTQTPGVSLGESREGVLEGLRAGTSARAIEQANAIAKQYATTLQMELSPALKELMGAFADPAKGAEQLNQKLDFLTTAQIRYIQQLQATKGPAEAAVALAELLKKALVDQKDASTGTERVLADLKTAWEQVADAVGKATLKWLEWQKLQAQTVGRGISAAGDFAFGGSVPPFQGGPPPTIRGETPRQAIGPLAETSGIDGQAAAARVATAEAEKLAKANAAIAASVATLNTAFANEVAVMNSTTVETRARATEQQVLNDLSEKGELTEKEYAQAAIAGNMVRAQAAATQAQTLAGQQAELSMSSQLIAAAGAQGAAGVALRAGLQEELAIRQAGLDVTSQDSQTRIANAEALARQKLAMQDVSQATQLTQSIQGQIQLLQLETQLIGANVAERAKSLSMMQSEIQARQLEAQGFEKAAAAVREYAGALAQAKANQVQAQEAQAAPNYNLDYHNQQASMLREMDMLRAQISAVGMSAGAAAETIKLQELANQELATTSEGAADAIRDNAKELARMTRRLEEAKEAEQERKQAIQAAKAADQAAASAFAQTWSAKNQGTFAAGGDEPLSSRSKGGWTFDRRPTWTEFLAIDAAAEARGKSALERIPDIQKQAQQRQLQVASSTIQDQIQALQDQKSATEENTDALEKETQKRKEQLDKQIAKLEKALNPSRPDPYAERNPDYFYRFGTQAFKENDPMQALLSVAEAERDGLDEQLDQQKKSVELQQKAIDEQIKGYEAQAKELSRASNLLQSGVDLSEQELAGIKAIVAAVQGLGDYARLQAANSNQMMTELAKANQESFAAVQGGVHIDPMFGGLAVPGRVVGPEEKAYGFQKGAGGFSGFFASGGYIPPGSWGIAGESGPEVISRKRGVAGPATVTPIGAGRPIVVNQTFVSQGGARELRASRGEIAQRSSSEMRRSLGAR